MKAVLYVTWIVVVGCLSLIGLAVVGVYTWSLFQGSRLAVIQWVSDPATVAAYIAQSEYPQAVGMADIGGRFCIIYALRPEGEKDIRRLKTLGHETLHCFMGTFHP